MDVVTAYLYGDIDTEIYLAVPDGIAISSEIKNQNPGLKLLKSLYGLKQSGRVWYETLTKHLIKLGFTNLRMSPCVFVRRSGNDIAIITIYVDDLNIIGTRRAIDEVKAELKRRFEMKDLGRMTFTLGMQFEYLKNGIFLHQSTYTRRLLEKFKMEDCNGRNVPLEKRRMEKDKDIYGPRKQGEKPLDPKYSYMSLIGALLYLSTTCRPTYHSQYHYWQDTVQILR